jgi:hypothetical protein
MRGAIKMLGEAEMEQFEEAKKKAKGGVMFERLSGEQEPDLVMLPRNLTVAIEDILRIGGYIGTANAIRACLNAQGGRS